MCVEVPFCLHSPCVCVCVRSERERGAKEDFAISACPSLLLMLIPLSFCVTSHLRFQRSACISLLHRRNSTGKGWEIQRKGKKGVLIFSSPPVIASKILSPLVLSPPFISALCLGRHASVVHRFSFLSVPHMTLGSWIEIAQRHEEERTTGTRLVEEEESE